MKILFATDLHFRASRPISRTDQNFLGTILAKLEYIKELAKQVDLVILGGDIFDRPDTPHSVVIRVNRAFNGFPCPVYSVIGNHDIYGYEGLTVDTTALGSLFEMGNVKRLDYLGFPETQDATNYDTKGLVHNPGIHIYGMHAFDDNKWMLPDNGGTKILVAHKMITDTAIPGCSTFLLDDIAPLTNANLVLSGDIHTPHSRTVEVGGDEVETGRPVAFINPGSLSRMSIVDRDRQPMVVIVDIGLGDQPGNISWTTRDIPSRPSETLFDLKAYSAKMASRMHTEEFIKTYVQAVVSVKAETNKIGDVLIEFLEKNGVGDKMRDISREYLERAQREVLQDTQE